MSSPVGAVYDLQALEREAAECVQHHRADWYLQLSAGGGYVVRQKAGDGGDQLVSRGRHRLEALIRAGVPVFVRDEQEAGDVAMHAFGEQATVLDAAGEKFVGLVNPEDGFEVITELPTEPALSSVDPQTVFRKILGRGTTWAEAFEVAGVRVRTAPARALS